jgi:hypothetical protein
MFKKNAKYIYAFAGVFIVIVLAQYLLPKPVNWRRSFQNDSKDPLGCYAIYELLDGTFGNKINSSKQTLYNLHYTAEENTSWLMVNDQISLGKNDLKSLLRFVEDGNKAFLAANDFRGALADTFHLNTNLDFAEFFTSPDSLKEKSGEQIRMLAKNLSKKKYTYSRLAWPTSFSNFDSTRFSILATGSDNKPCLLKASIGKGEIYLMSMPDIFTNYFIVDNPNRELAYNMLSLVKNENLIWDEYYKSANVKNTSPFKLILENDSLYAAWILLLLTIVFYMIFEGRRRQRSIPVTIPVTNSTLEFVNVISHVYFNEGNHQSIGVEKVKYFYESIRRKFHVSTQLIDEAMVNEVAELSGVDPKKVRQLFMYCEKIRTSAGITQFELAELNRQINNFNKHSLR